MRLFTIIVVLSFVVVSTVVSAPNISLSETNFNFGKVPQHTTVNHTFWIKSTGTDTLVITKIVPGCGCTKMPLADSVLAPGDSTQLEILFSTKSYRGYVAKRPYIETNISEDKIYIRIDSEIMPDPESILPVSFEPYKLDVSQFSEKPRRKAKFHLVNKGNQDLEMTVVDGKDKPFTVDIPKKIKAGETVEGMIDVKEGDVMSEFTQSFTIELNDEGRTRLSLPVARMLRIKK